MPKVGKYSDHPYVNDLMARTLEEKTLRPELIEAVAKTIDARCNQIRSQGDSFTAAVMNDPTVQQAIATKMHQLKGGSL